MIVSREGDVRMDPTVRAAWATALRSGDYAQGTHALCRIVADGSRQYCCLGVLCELAVDAGVAARHEFPDEAGEKISVGYAALNVPVFDLSDVDVGHLPAAVVSWAGLYRIRNGLGRNPLVRWPDRHGEYTALSYVNDSGRLDFTRIADLIEEQL